MHGAVRIGIALTTGAASGRVEIAGSASGTRIPVAEIPGAEGIARTIGVAIALRAGNGRVRRMDRKAGAATDRAANAGHGVGATWRPRSSERLADRDPSSATRAGTGSAGREYRLHPLERAPMRSGSTDPSGSSAPSAATAKGGARAPSATANAREAGEEMAAAEATLAAAAVSAARGAAEGAAGADDCRAG
jgi:hypothetical protein